MIKQFLSLTFCFLLSFSFCLNDIEPYSQETEEGYILYVDNPEPVMVSIGIQLKLENLKSTIGTKKIIVVPANTKKFKIAELSVIDEYEGIGYSSNTMVAWGDVTKSSYDKDYAYDLPYVKGKSYYISQGYFGEFSHQDARALDFEIPINEEIAAVRGGTVIEMEERFNKGCPSESCEQYANFIKILHHDGTIAEYSHLKHHGVKVKKGEIVTQGQVIGLGGNTGWTTGPHLHFVVYKPKINKRESIPTFFKVDGGTKKMLLKKGMTPLKGY